MKKKKKQHETKFKKLQKGCLQPIERKKSATQSYYGLMVLKF